MEDRGLNLEMVGVVGVFEAFGDVCLGELFVDEGDKLVFVEFVSFEGVNLAVVCNLEVTGLLVTEPETAFLVDGEAVSGFLIFLVTLGGVVKSLYF